ncbi:hypothetical protein G6F57_011538 [Rhizopus arrhizus]|nr:hypothetical protein G6F57_011538 [Rhizopus arrhizus]
MADETGETRRQRNARFGITEAPEMEIPDAAAHVWGWFWELSARRHSGPEALTFADIGQWASLLQMELLPEEVQMLMAMDDQYLRARLMDIAELGYKVDSSGLVEGTKALDENAAAADRAGAAAERLDKQQMDASRTASYWANEQAKINARVQEMERIEQRAAVATRQAATATEAHELNLQQLLGQINPTVAALNKLAEQQDRLARARDLGLLKPQVWQQYQANIDATRASVLNATGAQNGMGD